MRTIRQIKKIKILNLTYDLKWEEPYITDGNESWSWCDTDRQIIVVNKKATEDRARDCLLHEIIHAINNAVGLGDGVAEEAIAKRGASALLTVAEANKTLFRWIFKGIQVTPQPRKKRKK
jgi:Zn-dependent peptidase ImmA (M78 family)